MHGKSGPHWRLPCFREESATQMPELNGTGVSLAAMSYARRDGVRSILLSGLCQCTEAELEYLRGPFLHSIALLMTSRALLLPVSFSPMGDALVFEDDIRKRGSFLRFFFEVDVFARTEDRPASGVYYLSATFGPYLSNVVELHL